MSKKTTTKNTKSVTTLKHKKPKCVQQLPGAVMVDVAGTSLTPHEVKRLQHPSVGGVILFSRNYESPQQLQALTAEIHALRTPPLLIAVDHEGGRVQRFRKGFTHLPPMRVLGELHDQDPLAAQQAAIACGLVLATELRACGVDFSFTPVLDLDFGRSGVIGNRAFHRKPKVVVQLAQALNHGLLLAGMKNCGKHFPGHGHVKADSHVAIPVDKRSLDKILAEDMLPYNYLTSPALASIMPAHVIYPEVDKHPAGFSKVWLQKILRKQLNFNGVIFSDDLSMEGASVAGDVVARANAALKAGCHMVLVCNAPDEADYLLEKLEWDTPAQSISRILGLQPSELNVSAADYKVALSLVKTLG